MIEAYDYIDPGPLSDGELELVPASTRWLDAVMDAQQHPQTLRDSPLEANITRQRHVDFIASLYRGFHAGNAPGSYASAYHFWIRDRNSGAFPIVGGIGLRLGQGGNIERVIGHIGYQVYPFARGHHYAERACRLLIPLARTHGLLPLWITCNPDNYPSRRTCERLGAILIDIVKVPPDHPLYARGEREKCRYRL